MKVARKAPVRAASRRYRIVDGVAHREIEGQTLLLVGSETGLLTLNATGQFIWRRLQKGQDTAAIARAFQREFGVAADVAARDAGAFLDMLVARKLIRRV